MLFTYQIYKIISKSTCPHKDNIREVIKILRDNQVDFFIFFTNILIDFRILSIEQKYFLEFLDSYSYIDTSLAYEEIASNMHTQLRNHFARLSLGSTFSFLPVKRHINVMPHYTFHEEHYPEKLPVTLDDIYYNHKEHIDEKINKDLDGAESLRLPYRRKTDPKTGIIQKRIVWLAEYDQLFQLVDDYSSKKSVEKKDIQATAVNDILGLGFRDPTHDKTLFIYLIFPKTFNQKCYKPTFIDAQIYSYEETFFLSCSSNNGYGLTRSTDDGKYSTYECVTDSLDSLSGDFELGVLGYAESIIDRTNIVNDAIERLNKTK